ncbi:hypothetical protein [Amycolatopsis viridis]|uniref:Uncharacterized protein n=1 Tax=Amycolatopsis viridis TaxID=185678 RepID=A0ABX0SQV6_9PSEU|nr:hypothetical protein [Amycolatopsis viridis]NIH77720.1 hypothetical protein [Amycolatopsis viridis]
MRKTARRAGVAGFVLAASATLTAPGALADPAGPALAGSCGATLRDEPGHALTVDAGAPLGQPGVVTVGTGTDSAPTGPDQRGPLLPLPVADLAKALRVGDAPVVGDLATEQVCPAAQHTVNALSTVTQDLTSGEQPAPPAGRPAPGGATPAPGTTAPGTPAPNTAAPNTPAPGPGAGTVPVSFVTGGFLAGAGITSPAALSALTRTAPAAPEVLPPAGTEPPLVTQSSGAAEAMPAVPVPDRLPLIIAVFALAIVATALTRAWLRRA